MSTISPQMQATIDRMDIMQVLARHSHGVDRCDAEVLRSCYWDDATVDYAGSSGGAHEVVTNIATNLRNMERTLHSIGNILIDVNGDAAKSQTYCTAYHLVDGPNGKPYDMVVGGRYLDTWEKRNGEWKMSHRLYVMDWDQNMPATRATDGMLANIKTRGARSPDDPWYSWIKK